MERLLTYGWALCMRSAGIALLLSTLLLSTVVSQTPGSAAETPSVKLALTFKPVQKDVDIETPPEAEYSKCKVEVERTSSTSGWVVKGPAGQILRRFVDTNSDNIVDQWRYFDAGLEVYRDVDGNFNNKVDQSRWMNTAGTRWGVDSNEDGRIDEWKRISAEEASREAVLALVNLDDRRLSAVLVNAEDLEQIGLEATLRKQMLEAVSDPANQMREMMSKARSINAQSTWARFDNSTLMPGLVPADSGKAEQELVVYQSAMAIVETAGETSLVHLGEMVKIGESWKLTQIPEPIEGNSLTTTGMLMQPSIAGLENTGPVSGQVSEEMQALLKRLEELDKTAGQAATSPQGLAEYNQRRAALLKELIEASSSEDERTQWTKQMVDGIAAAVQTGNFPDGLKQLESLDAKLQSESPNSDLAAYVAYRRLLADYSNRIRSAEADERGEVQQWWLDQLETYVRKYREAEDTADALLQLAITQEFSGKLAEARKWYTELAEKHGDTAAAERARGALLRFELTGKQLTLTGQSLNGRTIDISDYRGRVVLVVFWATWCRPCTEDLPQLKDLYKQYRSQGFEVVGVNLDTTSEPIESYISQHGVPWPHIYEPGGLESGPARQFGIISLPTMFLVDKRGKVLSKNISVADLKSQLPELLEQ